MDLGLERAGFEVVGCLEIHASARETLTLNKRDWNVLEDGDVSTAAERLSPADVDLEAGELSILAGGPPCQPFSTAGQWASGGRAGLDDPTGRGRAVDGLLELVGRFLPAVVLIENVLGFVKGQGSALDHMQHKLDGINAASATKYRLQVHHVDAADYGAPQHRRRALVVALRDGGELAWPAATHSGDDRVTCWDALGDMEIERPPEPRGQWARLLPSIPEGCNYQWHTERGGGEPLFGYRRRYWSFLLKLAKNKPSWTISASPGPSTGPFHWDSRPLTIPERLRLQTFPEDWALSGSQRDQVMLVGNATPPLLAEVAGRALAEQVFGSEPTTPRPSLAIPRSDRPFKSTPVAAVPEEYLQLRGSHPAHPGKGLGPGAQREAARLRDS